MWRYQEILNKSHMYAGIALPHELGQHYWDSVTWWACIVVKIIKQCGLNDNGNMSRTNETVLQNRINHETTIMKSEADPVITGSLEIEDIENMVGDHSKPKSTWMYFRWKEYCVQAARFVWKSMLCSLWTCIRLLNTRQHVYGPPVLDSSR